MQFSSVSNKNNRDWTNHAFEQREVLLNLSQGKTFEIKCHKTL